MLFVDIVGFTSRSELLDPEDVRAFLKPYYEHVRREIEARGGRIEKFVGDAVLGIFGAPVAHGDDAERAVRTALAIRDSLGEMNVVDRELDLQARLAVNTGEVIVDLDARPEAETRWSSATSSTPQHAYRTPHRRTACSWGARPIPDTHRRRVRACAAGHREGKGRAGGGLAGRLR